MRFFLRSLKWPQSKYTSACPYVAKILTFHTIKLEEKEEDGKLNTMIETEITKNTKPEEQQVDNQSIKGIMI